MKRHSCTAVICLVAISSACVLRASASDDYPERSQDETIIETVLRLDGFDLNSSDKAKSSVLRYLQHNVGTPRFFDLVRRFRPEEASSLLLDLAIARPTDTEGVEAARLLLAGYSEKLIIDAIGGEAERAEPLVTALGLTGESRAVELLLPVLTDAERSLAFRMAAARAIGRHAAGQKHLLELATGGKLPEELKFTVANELHASADVSIRTAAAELLPLPPTADAEPLPPLAELVKMRGDPQRGKKVFHTVGTCANCHTVAGEGKEVGPDLSEIGSKLSREAMFVAILDPSAGISHNYETYHAVLASGTIFSGVKLSETDESVTLKSAEAIVRTFQRNEIDEIYKSPVSLMPADLQRVMTVEQLVDVVEYLMTLTKVSAGDLARDTKGN